MKTLIEAVEAWIDDRITNNIALDRADRLSHSATVDIQDLDAKFKEMLARAQIQANRIEDLERRIELWIDESDTARLDSVDSRLDDLECSMDEKVDSSDVDDRVESAMCDSDLPDSYAIEVMIDDALETKVMDAVRAELDATDFKITVER